MRPSHRVALWVLALAIGLHLLSLPEGWTSSTPLPWDGAGHTLRAMEVAQAWRGSDLDALRGVLTRADQYPPLHAVVAGLWVTLFGDSIASWWTFGAAIVALTAVLLARIGLVGALAFLGYALIGGLAPTRMVEPLAVLALVGTFAWLDRIDRRTHAQPGWRDAAILGALAASTILVKYNVGLPLLVALPCSLLVARRRVRVRVIAVATLLAVAAWVAFLAVQTDGWAMFARFAQNRANASDQGSLDRLLWYVRAFVEDFTLWPAAALALIGAAVLGVGRRSAVAVAAAVYVVVSLLALVTHPYLLARNLVGPAVALAVVAGQAAPPAWLARAWRRLSVHGRRAALGAFAVGLASLFLRIDLGHGSAIGVGAGPALLDARRQIVATYHPAAARELEGASRWIADRLAPDQRTLVVGSFNELSAGWLRLLAQRKHADALRIELPYPLEPGRSELDPRADPAYAQAVRSIEASAVDQILTLELADDSPLRSVDYLRWSAWKLNVVDELRASSAFVEVERLHASVGVTLRRFVRGSGETFTPTELAFVAGWGSEETWGRWMDDHHAWVSVPPLAEDAVLVVSIARSEVVPSDQTLEARIDGVPLLTSTFERPPWQWREITLDVPASSQCTMVELVASEVATGPGDRHFAVACRDWHLHPASDDAATTADR